MELGLYKNMPAQQYHDDLVCPEPSLSSTIAADLIQYTPRHVWACNKRLNPAYVEEQSDAKDKGSLLHDLVLLGRNAAELLDFNDFKTDKAKLAKKNAIAKGKIPILVHKWAEYEAIRKALLIQIKENKDHPDALSGGDFEASLFVKLGSIYARCRFDHVNFNTDWIDDYKTTGVSIDQWMNSQLFNEFKDIQAVHYSRCYKAHTGRKPKGFRYIVQETFAPYCMAIVELDIHSLEVAEKCHDWAMHKWSELVKVKPETWIGYTPHTHWASIPPYAETKRELRMFNEEVANDQA